MSIVILAVDIPEAENINNIEIDYYVYRHEYNAHLDKKLIKTGGIMNPKLLPKSKTYRQDKTIYDYDNGYVSGWNACLKEMGHNNEED